MCDAFVVYCAQCDGYSAFAENTIAKSVLFFARVFLAKNTLRNGVF